MKNRRKLNINWLIITIFGVLFVVVSLQTNQLMEQQNELSNDLTNLEYLSATTQRLSRMVLGDSNDTRVVIYIDEQTKNYLDSTSESRLYVVDDPDFQAVAEGLLKSWGILLDLFQFPQENDGIYDKSAIALAADNHFDNMTDLTIIIAEEKNRLTGEVDELQLTGYLILTIIFFFVLNDLICNSFSLKFSKELTAIAALDGATGLHNRSRCQDVFKQNSTSHGENQPAVIVIDLNDLKTTNDNRGHRIGDEMIVTFSKLLKDAGNIHKVKPFLGRYGGDEFVVYYEDTGDDDLQGFMKELAYLSSEFNKDDSKQFEISYAIGCAIHGKGETSCSLRQLFEEADENMYINKREMKKKRAENFSD